MLPCKHRFHLECIDQWLSARKPLCPICKWDALQPFTPLNAEEEEGAAEPPATTSAFSFSTRRSATLSTDVPKSPLQERLPRSLWHANDMCLRLFLALWEVMHGCNHRGSDTGCRWPGGDGLGAGRAPLQRQATMAAVQGPTQARLARRAWSAPAAAGMLACPPHPPTSLACMPCAAARTLGRSGLNCCPVSGGYPYMQNRVH